MEALGINLAISFSRYSIFVIVAVLLYAWAYKR